MTLNHFCAKSSAYLLALFTEKDSLVKPEVRDAIVEALEAVMQTLGETNYETGAAKLCTFFEECAKYSELAKDKEHLRCLLDLLPNFEESDQGIAVFSASKIPQLMAMTLPELVHQFSVRFTPRTGRPKALKQRQSVALIERILRPERDGYSRSIAMRSAAREFRVSFRYAQRAWQNRRRILSGNPDYTLEEALQWVGSKIKEGQNATETDCPPLISLPSSD